MKLKEDMLFCISSFAYLLKTKVFQSEFINKLKLIMVFDSIPEGFCIN